LDNLFKLEVLFDEGEMNVYNFLYNATSELRALTEASEVWLE